MEVKLIRSVIPIYLVGFVWLIYAFLLPLYRLSDFLIVIAVSAAVYFIAGAIIPKRKVMVEKLPLLAETADDRMNEMIAEANGYIKQIRLANDAIPNEEISKKIARIETLTKKTFDYIVKEQEQRSAIRRFINYYLPTTVKLLNIYETLDKQGVAGENISDTMKKIDEMLDTVGNAFEKQLDSLYANDAMDVSADITVMESIMKQEGLIGTGISDHIENVKGEK